MHGDTVGGPIRWRMHLGVPPRVVYQALNSDEGREAFWAESAKESDGVVEFRFANGFGYRGRVLGREPDRRFSIEYLDGVATFELASDGAGGTDLFLTHEGVHPGSWQEVHAGWLNVLFPLKACLVHGVDLRNRDPNRSWDQGYADQ